MEDVAGPALAAIRAAFGTSTGLPGLASDLVVTDPDGWVPASTLADDPAGLLAAGQRRWSAPPHVSAALVWKSYSYWLALPVAFGWVAARRVPHVTAAEVLVRFDAPRTSARLGLHPGTPVSVLPSDPLAASGNPAISVVPDEAALLGTLRRVLLDEHVDPLLAAVQRSVRLSRRLLLGSLAANIAHGARHAAGAVGASAPEAIATLIAALDLGALVEWTPGAAGRVAVHRQTCCLAFTLPEPRFCSDCCYRPPQPGA
ncbi:(2Fe-2S)-binding protein [Actinoplanes sp. M2I2]|uniref:(2Fe-2S)-binding protein n=1 Tax=Actinoplanes sp. M2I2 TaxID=1734444 RepID=UPI0020207FF8|nr:(2Fe-2S)-binding protein [Actinoplanes sp. M2I2]